MFRNKIWISFNDFHFNSYTGNTLELDIIKVFKINNFDAVIGNPPYNDASGNKGKGHTLWTKFIEISSSDSKTNLLEKKYGDIIFGLNDYYKQKYFEILVPEIIDLIRKYLKNGSRP